MLRAAPDLLPDGISLDIFDLSPIPLYTEGRLTDATAQAIRSLLAALHDWILQLRALPARSLDLAAQLAQALQTPELARLGCFFAWRAWESLAGACLYQQKRDNAVRHAGE